MKLPETGIAVDTSNNFLQEDFFRISSNSVVFDLLRNKIYKDPVMAICREIASNARDAHREACISDRPIEILLPNQFENTVIIRDFGNGIPKDRMYSIYLEYGSSTKRDSNVQSGAFGLGAKTPFALVDSFSIVTKTLDGYKRTYNAYIDETGIGKIALVSEVVSDEPTGTSIIIPANKKDYNKFAACIQHVTEFWDVKPNIKNYEARNNSKILEKSDSWFISTYKDQTGTLYQRYGDTKSHAVIDGIIYAIDFSQLGLSSEMNNFYRNSNISIVFSIGELSLIASRDAIHYNDQTKTALQRKLILVFKDIRTNIQNKINNMSSYKEAILFLSTFKGFLDFSLINFMWHDRKLAFTLLPNDFGVKKAFIYGLYGSNSLSRSNIIRHIDITNEMYFNDLNVEFTPKKIINKILNDNKISSVVVLINENKELDQFWEEQLQIKRLSSVKIVKEKVKRRSLPSSKDEVHGYKLCKNNRGTIGTSQYSFKKDYDGIYVLIDLKTGVCSSDDLFFRNYDVLEKLSKFLDKSIHAFTSIKEQKLAKSWTPLKKALLDKINTYDINEIANLSKDIHCVNKYYFVRVDESNSLSTKLSSNSLFRQYFLSSLEIENKFEKLSDVCNIFNMLKISVTTENKLKKLSLMVRDRYPILNDLDTKYVSPTAIYKYIQTVDELFLLKERENVK